MKFSVKAMDAKSLDLTDDVAAAKAKAKTTVNAQEFTLSVKTAEDDKLNGVEIIFKNDASVGVGAEKAEAHGKEVVVTGDISKLTKANIVKALNKLDMFKGKDDKYNLEAGGAAVDTDIQKMVDGQKMTLKGGAAKATSSVASYDEDGNVTDAVAAKGIDISSQKAANIAIKRIDSALKFVSDERAKLGAVQNRLEHTIKNVDTSAENLQASESRIRDVDMAKEMMNYTKQNILNQAAQAMLAQANQLPQGVLQLLR